MKSVCVYCGSAPGNRPVYVEAARSLGRTAAARGVKLVYGGASVGLMGALADAALAAGGEVEGVIPHRLVERELAHEGLTRLHVVETMAQRKQRMADLSDAFIALPGGIGTLDELFETITWTQLGIHAKASGLLDVDGYWGPLMAVLDRQVAAGFLRRPHAELLCIADAPDPLLDALARLGDALAAATPAAAEPPAPT
jgi:uncharacterized protein (TIGR00730 family)